MAISVVAAVIVAGHFYLTNLQRASQVGGEIPAFKGPRYLKLGTFAEITIRDLDWNKARLAREAALKEIDRVEALFSTWKEDSEISQINKRAAQEAVPVCAETFDILNKGIVFSVMSDGAFDITVAPLLELWKKTAKENRLPTDRELFDIPVGYKFLKLGDDGTVRFLKPGMKLEVCAYVEGYTVDRALAVIKETGVAGALVNIGGEVGCFGPPQGDFYWTIGIQDPFDTEESPIVREKAGWKIRLNNASISTSGNYRHYQIIQGRHYSHIVDPRSGLPAEILPSVTVIANDTMTADALATAISVIGPERGIRLVESLDNVECFLIGGNKASPEIFKSKGFDEYLIED